MFNELITLVVVEGRTGIETLARLELQRFMIFGLGVD